MGRFVRRVLLIGAAAAVATLWLMAVPFDLPSYELVSIFAAGAALLVVILRRLSLPVVLAGIPGLVGATVFRHDTWALLAATALGIIFAAAFVHSRRRHALLVLALAADVSILQLRQMVLPLGDLPLSNLPALMDRISREPPTLGRVLAVTRLVDHGPPWSVLVSPELLDRCVTWPANRSGLRMLAELADQLGAELHLDRNGPPRLELPGSRSHDLTLVWMGALHDGSERVGDFPPRPEKPRG